MKKLILLICTGILFSCQQNFEELNQDPDVVDSPPLDAVFTYVEKTLGTYKGSEWYYDNHQMMPWMQYLVMGEANNGDVNNIQPRGGKYDILYTDIIPHLLEIRSQISEKSDEQQEYYQKLEAVTYVVQVFHALRVTDVFGNIPYSEAGYGRSEGLLDPVYDDQQELFSLFITQLDDAITLLSETSGTYLDLSDADFIYDGDWDKWIKLANALKLRVAVRMESQDLDGAKQIISDVVADGRLPESDDDNFTFYISDTWQGSSTTNIEWKGTLWAAEPIVEFMKKTIDPRIRIFFEPNGYTQETIDLIGDGEIPSFIDLANDNEVLYVTEDGEEVYGYRYIGSPVSRNDPTIDEYTFVDNITEVGSSAIQISKWNRRLLENCATRYSGGEKALGAYTDVFLSYSEVCFMMAEFILKGYTSGSAEDWYIEGVRSSMTTYDDIATKQQLEPIVAGVKYTYTSITDDEINAYLETPEVKFDGENDLEKVYIQQYLNFFRLPDEGYSLGRRTGYPKFESSLLARVMVDDPDLPWPRRMVTPDPGDLNRANWHAANDAQGFTELNESPSILNSERTWWDKNNPGLGEGN